MQHQFTVPVPVEVAWSALLDLERVAPCMPGATLTKVEGNDFAGSVKVRLGPISLLYKGSGTFKDVDAEARRVVIDASGKDSRGNGTASATVTAVLTDEGGSTSVTVDTDLKVTGKPAQLGRGLISEVGGKIINQFSECLATRLSEETEPAQEPAAVEQPPVSTQQSTNGEHPVSGRAQASSAASSGGSGSGTPVGRRPAWRVTPPAEERADVAAAGSTAAEQPSSRADAVVTGRPLPSEEAIDLLGAAGTPVLKRVLPVAAAVVALAVLLRLLRRRRHR